MTTFTQFKIEHAVAYITLDQAEKHNAFDDQVIQELRTHLLTIRNDTRIRLLVLQAKGKHFCAGADLAWMKRMADLSYEDNVKDAQNLASLLAELNDLPVPSIARVQGAAYGGAIGLIACCDIAICSDDARFCLSEVKLGLAPATIGPYVVNAMGARQCRKLFITAELFNASDAVQYGLIHNLVPLEGLDEKVDATIQQILQTGPLASQAAKKLVSDISRSKNQSNMLNMTSELIAQLRVSEEGQEGLNAFFEKRKPTWIKPNE